MKMFSRQSGRIVEMNILKKLFIILCFLLAAISFQNVAQAKILIVSPHPDDDVIAFAGVTLRALARGEAVKVVYITNGDYLDGQNLATREKPKPVTAQKIV